MIRNARFWILMTVFQVFFGLAIFALTRQYYLPEPEKVSAENQPSMASPDRITAANPAQPGSSTLSQPMSTDPGQLSRQADEFFANQQYDRAAELYQQFVALHPNDVNTYNNLGLTLHYLGRSAEALLRLNEGVAVDPTYQRIWLTLGFVNLQLGNTDQARTALTTAVQMGTDNEVGQSALAMLGNLPLDDDLLVDSH